MSSNIRLHGLLKGEGNVKRQVYEVLEVGRQYMRLSLFSICKQRL